MEQLQNTWNTVFEHFMVLYGVLWLPWGLTTTQYYKFKSTGSDLYRSSLIDTRSTENDWIGANTDPQYRIDASLLKISQGENQK